MAEGAILFSHLPIEHGLTFIKGVLMNATAKKAVAATMQSHKAVKQVQLLGCKIFVNLLKDGKYKGGGGRGAFYFILFYLLLYIQALNFTGFSNYYANLYSRIIM